MKQEVHGIVLAGGKSSRMGTDKALLPIHGVPLITHITNLLLTVCQEVTVVVSAEKQGVYKAAVSPQVRFAQDVYQGHGPLAGLHAGLLAMKQSYGFLFACDMPLFSRDLFDLMSEQTADGQRDAVLCPGQPFHAFYHKRTAMIAEACLQKDERRMSAFLEAIAPVYLPSVEERCFLNLNTPEDYQGYLSQWEKS